MSSYGGSRVGVETWHIRLVAPSEPLMEEAVVAMASFGTKRAMKETTLTMKTKVARTISTSMGLSKSTVRQMATRHY